MTGLHLSHYAIESELGRGGMGIVFRAKDTKLNRTVALKVLPAGALASQDDRARFRREAQAAAQINHANVCHVYQVDEAQPLTADGKPVEGQTEPRLFIAMEYIEGETLHDYVKKGPLKLQEAVNIAGQVAEALKVAHAKDIVHRDIKSANIMLTEGGVAKVLDFGLAKTNQSTMLTRMGSTLGTVAYMSPEQARGEEVDGRSDLYSLGTMLYEMIAGRLPYSGDYEQAVIYGILNEPPEPLTSVRTGVPMQLEWVVNKLLAKDADHRYQSAAGLLADLKSLDLTGSGQTMRSLSAASHAVGRPARNAQLPMWGWGLVVIGILAAMAAGWLLKPVAVAPDPVVVRFELDVGKGLSRLGRRSVAISPDGRVVAMVTEDGVEVRRMENLGTVSMLASGRGPRSLFFSWDSEWLAYEDQVSGWLMRVPVGGGPPTRIANLTERGLYGASWAETGDIFLGFGGGGMGRVPSAGGVVESILDADSTLRGGYQGPRLLPDGQTLLYTWTDTNWSDGKIRLLNMESGVDVVVHEGAMDARYIDTGHLVFLWEGSLYALPFDPVKNQSTGGPVPVAQDVAAAFEITGSGQFDVSRQGTLVSLRGSGVFDLDRRMEWTSMDGSSQVVLSPDMRVFVDPVVSPDGSRIAVRIEETRRAGDIWIVETARGTATRLTTDGNSSSPAWAPDGQRLAYAPLGREVILARYPLDPERIDTLMQGFGLPESWSPDGRHIAYEAGPNAASDIHVLDLESGQTQPFLDTDADSRNPQFSPDGRWIAYQSDDASGTDQVYVRPFPSGVALAQASEVYGSIPRWSRDGKILYFATSRSLLRFAEFDSDSGTFQRTQEVPLPSGVSTPAGFGVHPDGRLLVLTGSEVTINAGFTTTVAVLDFVINFDDELRRRAPVGQ